MGFGFLVFGCLLLLPVAVAFFYTAPIACLLLGMGLHRLRRVNVPFGDASIWAWISCGASCVAIILRLIPATSGIAHWAEGITYALLLLLHLRMLTGLEWVAEETRMAKLKMKAFRNKIFVCIYFVPALFLTLLDGIPAKDFLLVTLNALNIAIPLVGLVVLLLNVLACHTAYMYICMPEDLDMPVKPSRFAFVNAMRARRAERDAREQAEIEAQMEARRQEYRRKQQGRRKKK
jgi:hypothetical protein